MEFALGRGRAAPSDDLSGQVSRWLWAGPFTLGAVWPPRFLPPLPFHPLLHACLASRVGCCAPGTVSALSLGPALLWAVSGQGSCSPPPGSILLTLNAIAQLHAPWEGTGSLQDLSPSFSRSHLHLVVRCPPGSSFSAPCLTGLRLVSFGSEVGTGFPAARMPYITTYLLLAHVMVNPGKCVPSPLKIFSLLTHSFHYKLVSLFTMRFIYLFALKICPVARGYEDGLTFLFIKGQESQSGWIWVGSSEVLRTRAHPLPSLPAPCSIPLVPLVHSILN